MNRIRAFFRLIYLILFTIWIVGSIIVVTLVKGFRLDYAMKRRRFWAQHALKAIGVHLVVEGTPPAKPCLILCNHRSYLDPLIILSDVLAFPVSKAEVEHWPVLGYGAKATGIVYLKRDSLTSRKQTLSAISDTIIKDKKSVFLFPEGTTWDTPLTGPFKRGTFQLASSEGIDIVPAAIHYPDTADYWIGKDPFVAHFMRRMGQKKLEVRIRYGHPVYDENTLTLLNTTKSWIDQQLIDFQTKMI